jgi:opacity protein-like surface antigen
MFALAALTLAVSLTSAQDDVYRVEGFGGYSYMNLDRAVELDQFSNGNFNRVNSHGFNGSVTYNFSRYWGAKFDLTLHTHGEDFQSTLTVNPLTTTTGTFKTSQSDYQYMGGVQIKDNSKDGPRFKPFAHVLAGISDQHFSIDQTSPVNTQLVKLSKTGFGMKFGGGVDYKLTKNLDARFIQFDFNPIWRGSTNFGTNFGTVDSAVRTNWLLTFGIAVH